jgi:hypothetical protein
MRSISVTDVALPSLQRTGCRGTASRQGAVSASTARLLCVDMDGSARPFSELKNGWVNNVVAFESTSSAGVLTQTLFGMLTGQVCNQAHSVLVGFWRSAAASSSRGQATTVIVLL